MSTSPFSMSVSVFLPCKPVHLYHFSRFHIYVLIYDICFSLSDLLHSVWQTLGPSTSLQMTQFCSFLWLSNILLYTCTTFLKLVRGEDARSPFLIYKVGGGTNFLSTLNCLQQVISYLLISKLLNSIWRWKSMMPRTLVACLSLIRPICWPTLLMGPVLSKVRTTKGGGRGVILRTSQRIGVNVVIGAQDGTALVPFITLTHLLSMPCSVRDFSCAGHLL